MNDGRKGGGVDVAEAADEHRLVVFFCSNPPPGSQLFEFVQSDLHEEGLDENLSSFAVQAADDGLHIPEIGG